MVLTRIASANCGSIWAQTFSYDAFGNINKSGNSSFGATYSPATNRMTTIGTSTPTYDADGNVTNDFLHAYAWDGYGRPVTVDGVGITYDALGRMVEQNRSGAYNELIYSPTGFLMQTSQYLFVPNPGGGATVWSPAGIYYRHADWLGSSRFASTTSRTMYYDGAYAPFGEQYANSGTTDLSFTGMDSDTSANLYDFSAREYGIQGRWPSPDPAGLAAVDPSNPQSWNRYAYVGNNPLALTDPSGMCFKEDSFLDSLADIFGDWDDCSPQAPPAPSGGYGAGVDPFTGVCVQVSVGGVPTPGTGGCSLFSNGINFNGDLNGLAWFVPSGPVSSTGTLGMRLPSQTWRACMSANSVNYSISGVFFNGNGQLVAGNDVASLLFGNASEGTAGLLFSHGGSMAFEGGVGTAMSAGRRTASITELNLKGITGPAPKILGKTGAEGIAGWLSGAAELKMAADGGLTGAEAFGCALPQ